MDSPLSLSGAVPCSCELAAYFTYQLAYSLTTTTKDPNASNLQLPTTYR